MTPEPNHERGVDEAAPMEELSKAKTTRHSLLSSNYVSL
jgi:hypothetical protein